MRLVVHGRVAVRVGFIASNDQMLLRMPPLYIKRLCGSSQSLAAPKSSSRRSQIFASPLQPMSSSSRKIAAANGFGRGSLTVSEAWALYHA
jgi:hypothetical protein